MSTDRVINQTRYPPAKRRMPVGAEMLRGGIVHFRVWAPERRSVSAIVGTEKGALELELQREPGGYFSGSSLEARPGMSYRFRLDERSELHADPASRFQPRGPLGPSEIIDPNEFIWSDHGWQGACLNGQVIYEMHIGTYTQEGTWQSAILHLREIVDLGVTLVELMPVSDFPGDYGWGYDGVNLFAPTRLYGRPGNMKSFVNAAHSLGLGVILDIVYNHVGPVGNMLKSFSSSYFTSKYENKWGEAINYDGPNSAPVREYFISNAEYWIREFHLDGFRIDAAGTIFDQSKTHILAEISQKARKAAGKRNILLIAENEDQESNMVRPVHENGLGFDGLWNDDFHHSASVALTGDNHAYYYDYRGRPQEFVSCAKRGYLFQGQWYGWGKKRRGKPTDDLAPATFVNYLQNHDQIANSLRGQRIHLLTSPGKLRAMTALVLLAPGTPMLFQGQEFGSSAPFVYFGNTLPEIYETVFSGRLDFLRQFCNFSRTDMEKLVPRPDNISSFEQCKLQHNEKLTNASCYLLHRDLLQLRRTEPAFSRQAPGGVDGAVLGQQSFVLRFWGEKKIEERLLIVNLGIGESFSPCPEPILAPVQGMFWRTLWSSEDPKYGGSGTGPLEYPGGWHLPGEAALILEPSEIEQQGCSS